MMILHCLSNVSSCRELQPTTPPFPPSASFGVPFCLSFCSASLLQRDRLQARARFAPSAPLGGASREEENLASGKGWSILVQFGPVLADADRLAEGAAAGCPSYSTSPSYTPAPPPIYLSFSPPPPLALSSFPPRVARSPFAPFAPMLESS